MATDPNDRLDDLSDAELAAIEDELRQAAEEHRIDLEKDDVGPVEDACVRAAMDGAAEARIADLDRRAQELLENVEVPKAEQPRPKGPFSEEEERAIHSKLDGLESSAARARQTRHTRLAKESESKKQDQGAAVGLGVGMSFMFAMVGMLLVGLFVGYLIDNSNGTTVWRGYGAVIGASLGMLFGLYQLNRFQNRM